MNEEYHRVQAQENRALRQFIYYLGFDPYVVIAELLDPSDIAQKSAALSTLKVTPDLSKSTLSKDERKFVDSWLQKLTR